MDDIWVLAPFPVLCVLMIWLNWWTERRDMRAAIKEARYLMGIKVASEDALRAASINKVAAEPDDASAVHGLADVNFKAAGDGARAPRKN